jgi:hypothetical protein
VLTDPRWDRPVSGLMRTVRDSVRLDGANSDRTMVRGVSARGEGTSLRATGRWRVSNASPIVPEPLRRPLAVDARRHPQISRLLPAADGLHQSHMGMSGSGWRNFPSDRLKVPSSTDAATLVGKVLPVINLVLIGPSMTVRCRRVRRIDDLVRQGARRCWLRRCGRGRRLPGPVRRRP